MIHKRRVLNNIASGFGSVIGSLVQSSHVSMPPVRIDEDGLRTAWKRVGDDLSRAMEQFPRPSNESPHEG